MRLLRLNKKSSGGGSGLDAYTVLLLHCDGADASTVFTDDSVSAHVMTANGNAQIDTAQKKFGTASGLFDSTSTSDCLSTPDSDDWDFGAGDFTIDLWIRPLSAIDNADIISQRQGAIYCPFTILKLANTYVIYASSSGTSWDIALGTSLGTAVAGTWTHLAITRNGNNWYCFNNGTLTASWVSALSFMPSAEVLNIGGFGGFWFNGHIDEIRLSKGIARWITDFTPPTEPYGAGGGKKLLRDKKLY